MTSNEIQPIEKIVSFSGGGFSRTETPSTSSEVAIFQLLPDSESKSRENILTNMKPLLGIKSDDQSSFELNIGETFGGNYASSSEGIPSSGSEQFSTYGSELEYDNNHMTDSVVTILGPKVDVEDLLPENGIIFNKRNVFDSNETAEGYYAATPEIPEKYTQVLQEEFSIKEGDSVIDIGSGNGILAIRFAELGANVVGIDPSRVMIDMAKKEDTERRVTWINNSAEEFQFEEGKYDVIFSHDSFHLIKNPHQLIQRISSGLKPGGFFAIGSTNWVFDTHPEASRAIRDVYIQNIPGETEDSWGNWACHNFSKSMSDAGLSVRTKNVSVESTHTVNQIVTSSVNVSRVAGLSKDKKDKMAKEFFEKLNEIFPDGKCVGKDEYSILYGQKAQES